MARALALAVLLLAAAAMAVAPLAAAQGIPGNVPGADAATSTLTGMATGVGERVEKPSVILTGVTAMKSAVASPNPTNPDGSPADPAPDAPGGN